MDRISVENEVRPKEALERLVDGRQVPWAKQRQKGKQLSIVQEDVDRDTTGFPDDQAHQEDQHQTNRRPEEDRCCSFGRNHNVLCVIKDHVNTDACLVLQLILVKDGCTAILKDRQIRIVTHSFKDQCIVLSDQKTELIRIFKLNSQLNTLVFFVKIDCFQTFQLLLDWPFFEVRKLTVMGEHFPEVSLDRVHFYRNSEFEQEVHVALQMTVFLFVLLLHFKLLNTAQFV